MDALYAPEEDIQFPRVRVYECSECGYDTTARLKMRWHIKCECKNADVVKNIVYVISWTDSKEVVEAVSTGQVAPKIGYVGVDDIV